MTWGLHGVSASFGATQALVEVDCTVAPGTILAIIGPDGAGKSTIARVQVGLVEPDAGTVAAPPRTRVAYQPEAGGTWTDLSVQENLRFVASAHGLGAEGEGRIDHLLAITNLTDARQRLAGQLSGGMRQKLAVAMAMLPDPQLLVLDEPTTGLDPVSRGDVWRLLARTAADGTAVMVTTAYLDEAERADDVVVMDHGNVLVRGTADDIRASFPGRLVQTTQRDPDHPSWRRGRTWRTWIRDPEDPSVPTAAPIGDGARRALAPDLEDVVMAAALARAGGGA